MWVYGNDMYAIYVWSSNSREYKRLSHVLVCADISTELRINNLTVKLVSNLKIIIYSTQINKFLSTILNIQGEMLLDLGSCSTLNCLVPRKMVSLESFNSSTRTGGNLRGRYLIGY